MTAGASRQVRLGVIGAGRFGGEILKIVAKLPDFEIVGFADVNQAAAEELAGRYSAPSWGSYDQLLDECDCDAVAIFTPHNTHREIALAAAAAKRHIFCEKAMAIDVRECHDMIDAAAENGVKLMVGHKRRFRPAYQELKRLLDGGDFGRPLGINVNGYFGNRIGSWWASREACGGLLHWAGVHDVDTIRYLLGEVEEVSAFESVKVDHDLSDYSDAISVSMRFASGAVGSLQVSTLYPMGTYRTAFGFDIVCENGGMSYDPRKVAVHHQLHDRPMQTTFFEGYGHDVAFVREWSSFAGWVLRDETPVLTGEDGLRCVEIIQAAYISVAEGARVTLPLDRNDQRPRM